jgi:hypothetical protein
VNLLHPRDGLVVVDNPAALEVLSFITRYPLVKLIALSNNLKQRKPAARVALHVVCERTPLNRDGGRDDGVSVQRRW